MLAWTYLMEASSMSNETCNCPCCQQGIEAPHEYHLERRPMPGTFACPICRTTTPHHHTDDEIEVARLMAMPEAEVDAELRRLGIDPDEAARQGKAAVEGALEAIRARNAGVGEVPQHTEAPTHADGESK